MRTKAHTATHTDTKIEKYNTMSLAANSKEFKKYHKTDKHGSPDSNKYSM